MDLFNLGILSAIAGLIFILNAWSAQRRSTMTDAERKSEDAYFDREKRLW